MFSSTVLATRRRQSLFAGLRMTNLESGVVFQVFLDFAYLILTILDILSILIIMLLLCNLILNVILCNLVVVI